MQGIELVVEVGGYIVTLHCIDTLAAVSIRQRYRVGQRD
jgi:hypothetical protein